MHILKMFITAVRVVFFITLRWLKSKRLYCNVSLHKTLHSYSTFPSQGYKWVSANLMLGDPVMDKHSIQGGRNTPSRFMALKLEITASLMGHFACLQTMCFLGRHSFINIAYTSVPLHHATCTFLCPFCSSWKVWYVHHALALLKK